jgi:calcium-dependent protein kinase
VGLSGRMERAVTMMMTTTSATRPTTSGHHARNGNASSMMTMPIDATLVSRRFARSCATTTSSSGGSSKPVRCVARRSSVVAKGFLSDWLAKNDDDGDKKKRAGRGADRSSARQKKSEGGRVKPRTRAPVRRDEIASPFEDFTDEELRPDFGFRRDLEELYDVPSLDEEPIGAGSYGVVRKAVSRKTGEAFALKTLKKAPWKTAPASKAAVQYYHGKLRNEVEVMRTIGASLSVVYLYDAFEDHEHVHLLMELCSGGELLDRISMSDSNDYREAKAADLVKSVLRTAVQCHRRGIIYRDIKPDNFLFQTDDEDSPLKATDFGLAGKLPPKGETLARRCGTPSYMAPEVIERNYGSQADVWSAGVVAYQLLSGRLPFVDKVNSRPNAKEVFRAILEDEIDLESEPWPSVSEEAKDFVRKLLDRDPESRPTARAALLHPWLTQSTASWKAKAAKGQDSALDGQVVARLQRFATQGLLKRSVLRLIARELLSEDEDDLKTMSVKNADVQELKELFNKLDTSGDNMVELSELEVGLREIGYDVTGKESKQLLGSLDTSGDGLIDVNEFLAALLDWEKFEKTSAYPRWVERAFKILDKDNSGLIDAEEVASLIFEEGGEQNDSVRASIVKACISEADIDGNGKIDMDEFASLLQADPTDDLDQYDSRELSSSMEDSIDSV